MHLCDADDLDFDEIHEAHLARHGISATQVTQVWLSGPVYVPNKKGLTATWLMLGDSSGGRSLAIAVTTMEQNTPYPADYRMEQHCRGVDEMETGEGNIAIMKDDELAKQIEGMRDDAEAWGDPAAAEPERKRKSERRQRGAMVSVRFSPDELASVQEHAAEAGMSVSGYVRDLALKAAGQPIVIMGWGGPMTVNASATEERLLLRDEQIPA